ncbi:ankyrin repeat-containing domain protein [Trichoderma compactum]
MGSVLPIRQRTSGPALVVADIWKEALDSYERVTGTRIDQLQRTTNIDEILSEIGARQSAFSLQRHNGSRLDRFRTIVSESLAPIEAANEIVSQAVKAAFPPAEAIFAAIRHLIKTANAVSADYDKISGFFEDLKYYLQQLQVIDVNVQLIPQLKVALTGVFESVLLLCGICTKYSTSNRIMKSLRTLVSSQDSELKTANENFRKRIQQARDIVSHATYAGVEQLISHSDQMGRGLHTNTELLLQIDNRTQSVINTTAHIQKHFSDIETAEERDKIIMWLSSLSFLTKQKDTYAKYHQGTGKWLLNSQSFQIWFNGNMNSTFSCRGIPGSGKTTLLSAAVSYVEEETDGQNCAIVCIYCDYKDPRTRSEVELISSIIRQLAEQCKPLPPAVKAFRDKYLEKRTDPSSEERLSLIKTLSQLFDKTYVFVDALDECPEENRDELLNLLKELEPHIRLFTTSRPNVDISSIFDTLFEMKIEAHESDIRAYLEHRITKTSKMTRFIARDQQLKDDIIRCLLEKSNGMFLLARLQIDYLCKNFQSALHARRALNNLSGNLNLFYEDTLKRIEDQEESSRALATKAISYIYCAKRPLKTQELIHALSIEPGFTELYSTAIIDRETLLSVSHGLISVNEENNGTAELAHYTLHEFLGEHQSHMIRELEMHLAHSCITYLLFDEFGKGPCTDAYSVEKRLDDHCFLDYASRNWGSHLRQSQSQDLLSLALVLLHDEKKLGATVQILYLPRHRKNEWHDDYPHGFTALHVIAYWGLDKMMLLLATCKSKIDVKAQDSRGETALHLAAQQGHLDVLRLLLQAAADVDTANGRGETPLIRAARNGHTALVECLLQSGADALAEDNEKWTAFHWAIIGNSIDTAKLLLRYQANSDGLQLNKALDVAAEAGNETAVQMVLDLGANIDWKDDEGSTAITWAVPGGYENAVRTLLRNGADPNLADNYGNVPLHWAIPYSAITELLLEYGANINAQNDGGRSALHWSALEGQEDTVEILLSHNADVRAKDTYGCTALHAASLRGLDAMAQRLIERGADPNERDKDGWTPLHAAVIRGQNSVIQLLVDRVQHGDAIVKELTERLKNNNKQAMLGERAEEKLEGSSVVQGLRSAVNSGHIERMLALLENGADIDEMDQIGGGTALTMAVWLGRRDIATILLENGADANRPNRLGETGLHMAISSGDDLMVKLLVDNGADVNHERYGWTPLLLAASKNYHWIVRFLVKKAADVNATDYHDQSALHWAAKHGAEDVIRLLIVKGAAVDAMDDHGKTPLICAIEKGDKDSVRALLMAGADVKSDRCLALHAAAASGRDEIVRQLLSQGANVNAKTQGGITAFQIATLKRKKRIARLLRKGGADETKVSISVNDAAQETGQTQGQHDGNHDDPDGSGVESLNNELRQLAIRFGSNYR